MRAILSKSLQAVNRVSFRRGLKNLVIGVPKETLEGEARVALTPPNVVKLKKAGVEIKLEAGAGVESGFTDAQYAAAGMGNLILQLTSLLSCRCDYHKPGFCVGQPARLQGASAHS